MIVKHYQFESESLLQEKEFEAGAIYYIEDTGRVYMDPVDGNTRILVTGDPIILETRNDLDAIFSPIPGRMYFVLEESKYYIQQAGKWYVAGGSIPRAGIIYAYPVEAVSANLIDGFLWCDGASYARTDYPELFAAIGATYGAVDDTHFNVPDLRGKSLVGAGGSYTLNSSAYDIMTFENMTVEDENAEDADSKHIAVNYIISTGRNAEVMTVSEFITSVQTLPLAIEYGGTGANNAATARANLNVPSIPEMEAAIAGIDIGGSIDMSSFVTNEELNEVVSSMDAVSQTQLQLKLEEMAAYSAGLMYPWPSATLPNGFLWCDGASYARADYVELFAAIGAVYGAVDDDHFNVPDLRERSPLGAGTNYNLGYSGQDDISIVNGNDGAAGTYENTTYTVINYIISTGKEATTVSVSEIITGAQTLPLGIEYGGTGATNAAAARANLGVPSVTEMEQAVANVEVDLSDYITSDQLDAKDYVSNTELTNKNYATKTEVGTEINNAVSDLVTNTALSNTMSSYSTTAQVDTKIANATSGLVSETELNAKDYASKTEVGEEINSAVTDLVSNTMLDTKLADYSTSAQVDNKITEATSNFVTEEDLEAKNYVDIDELNNTITGINPVTPSQLEAKLNEISATSAGMIYLQPSATLPNGFLWCDGASYARADYVELFAAIGAVYGAVDDDHFNVPDLRIRVPMGSGKNYPLGYEGADDMNFVNVSEGATSSIEEGRYTVINYIIATGKELTTLSASEIVSGIQTLPLSIEYGGTSATSAAAARANLGVPSIEEMQAAVANVEVDLSDYVTTAALNQKNYVTTTELNEKGYATSQAINDAITGIDAISETQVDAKLASYYTKTQADSAFISPSELEAKDYATKDDVNTAVTGIDCITEAQVNTKLGSYYTKTQADSAFISPTELEAKNYATKDDVNTAVTGIDCITEAQVDAKLASYYTKTQADSAFISPSELEAKDYATKDDVNTAVTGIDCITEAQVDSKLGSYYTKTQADAAFISPSELDAKDYATKSDVNNTITNANLVSESEMNTALGSYSTSTQVDNKITTALGSYYTKTETNAQINSAVSNLITTTSLSSTLSSYSTSTQVDSKISSALSSYSTTTQVNSKISSATSGMATQTYVNNKVAAISIPTLKQHLAGEAMVLSSLQYGSSFPSNPVEGQLFFKVISAS